MGPISFSVAMKPMVFVLYLSGLYSLPATRTGKCCYVWKHALNIALALPCFVSLFTPLVGEIYSFVIARTTANLYLLSYMSGQVFVFVGFRICCQKQFRAFFVAFESYKSRRCKSEVNCRAVVIVTILAVLFLVGDVGVCVYHNLTNMDQCYTKYRNIPAMFCKIMCQQVWYGITLFYSNQIFIMAFFLYLSVWTLLKTEANSIVEGLLQIDTQAVIEAPEVIDNIRLRHADLCHLIARANRCMRHILAAFYGAGVTCILLVIHGVVNGYTDFERVLAMGFMFFGFVLYLIVVTLTGAALNLKMHEPVDFLFRLDVQRMTGKGSEIVSAFLARVQGAPIGFNVYNLFTVDTSAIMMICGTILTYTLVIVQFKPLPLAASSSTDSPPAVTSAYTEYQTYVNTTGM